MNPVKSMPLRLNGWETIKISLLALDSFLEVSQQQWICSIKFKKFFTQQLLEYFCVDSVPSSYKLQLIMAFHKQMKRNPKKIKLQNLSARKERERKQSWDFNWKRKARISYVSLHGRNLISFSTLWLHACLDITPKAATWRLCVWSQAVSESTG